MSSREQLSAQALDAQDVLAHFRERFVIADEALIYLDGNSLGRLPVATQRRVGVVVEQEWGDQLIRGWNAGWIDAAARVGAKVAAVVGANPNEVIIADSTSVNLFKLALAALRSRPGRKKIVTDDMNFPSDLYILKSVCQAAGTDHRLEIVRSEDGVHGPLEDLRQALDEHTALLTLSHTAFKSGYTYDMAAVSRLAHQAGAMVLWDLSHSAGVLPIDLEGANADLAVGCTYKYLNGGPGAPAFLYVRRDLQSQLSNPVAGWMGHRQAFEFAPDYEPAPGLRRFLTGTPPILSLAAIEPGVDLVLEAGVDRLRRKSVGLSEYLVGLWSQELEPLEFRLRSPRDARWRGSHVSFGHQEGHRIDLALIEEMKVLPDFRRPDNIRLGLAPLYTTYAEVELAVARLAIVVRERRYARYVPAPGAVT